MHACLPSRASVRLTSPEFQLLLPPRTVCTPAFCMPGVHLLAFFLNPSVLSWLHYLWVGTQDLGHHDSHSLNQASKHHLCLGCDTEQETKNKDDLVCKQVMATVTDKSLNVVDRSKLPLCSHCKKETEGTAARMQTTRLRSWMGEEGFFNVDERSRL